MRIVRCLVGFILAGLTCSIVHVLFVLPPTDYAVNPDYMTTIGVWVSLAFLHSAVFAAPFALAGIVWGERRSIRHWGYYVGLGAGIAVLGLVAQLVPLGVSQPPMVVVYLLTALVAGGSLGGLIYWLIAGRKAGKA